MDFIPGLLSGASTLIMFCILGGTLWKVMQISADVQEIKSMLQRRSAPSVTPALPIPAANPQPAATAPAAAAPPALPGAPNAGPISPEDLVRAVHAQGYDAIVTDAEILPPRL